MGIAEQLRDFCDCVKYDDSKLEALTSEIISVVSAMTCWQNGFDEITDSEGKKSLVCQTFLFGTRKEVITLPECMDCPYEFKPFYHPYDVDSFAFTLITQKGIEETSEVITDFSYSEVDHVFRLNLPLPSCKCQCKECGCPTTYKLLVTYSAGYEELPECLLPVFCNLLDVVAAKNTCDCDCAECDTKYSEDNIKYAEGDIVTVQLETDLGKLLVEQYKKQLAMISLCDDAFEYWGVVV